MIIQKNKDLATLWFSRIRMLIFLGVGACSTGPTDDPIPVVPFANLTINLSFPEYQSLAVDGGVKEMNNLGVRGVILYRKSSSTYIAYERNCSYHPNDACATVNVHTSGLYMTDPCCGSTFSFTDGTPSGGLAWRPLRRYRTELAGSSLTITNEIAP